MIKLLWRNLGIGHIGIFTLHVTKPMVGVNEVD